MRVAALRLERTTVPAYTDAVAAAYGARLPGGGQASRPSTPRAPASQGSVDSPRSQGSMRSPGSVDSPARREAAVAYASMRREPTPLIAEPPPPPNNGGGVSTGVQPLAHVSRAEVAENAAINSAPLPRSPLVGTPRVRQDAAAAARGKTPAMPKRVSAALAVNPSPPPSPPHTPFGSFPNSPGGSFPNSPGGTAPNTPGRGKRRGVPSNRGLLGTPGDASPYGIPVAVSAMHVREDVRGRL